jgi:hypothetical protein
MQLVYHARMREPRKTGLYRLGGLVLKLSVAAAMVGLVVWLFAPDLWTSGKSAAASALVALPIGLALFALTRLAAWVTDSK